MIALTIGNSLPTRLIRDQYILKCIFSDKDEYDYEELWIFSKVNESDLVEAITLIKEYLALPHNQRCDSSLFQALDKPEIVQRIENSTEETRGELDEFLEDIYHSWPRNSNYDSRTLDTFYVIYYDTEGDPYEVTVKEEI